MDLEKYQRLFVEEARENLRVYHQSMSALDADTSNAERRSEEVIHELFRAAHSMKGMAASLGHTHFAEVAHGLEELADRSRQGESLSREDIDLLVSGGDLLSQLLEQVQDGEQSDEVACTTLLGQIRNRLSKAAPEFQNDADTDPSRSSADHAALATESFVVHANETALKVWLESDVSMPKARAFLVHRQVSQLDQFLRADPTPETWSDAHENRGFLWYVFSKEGLPQSEIAEQVQNSNGVACVEWHEAAAVEPKAIALDAEPELRSPVGEISPIPAKAKTSQSSKIWQRSVRVRAGLLDGFMDSVSELLLTRAKLRAVASQSNETKLLDLVDEIERQIRDLHARVVAARMTPLHFLTDGFPRSVRDMARQTGKAVKLVIEGADIEVDRAILDELHAPMVHLLRNSIDHGHEGNVERRARDKNEQMTIRLRAQREDEHLVLLFEDDGGGVDSEQVAQRALKKGLITSEQLAALKKNQILDLICTPGFSTKMEVTELSGRGVGMDVVKQGVERLGGKLEISSNLGAGTRIQIRLPLTVSLMQALLVEALISETSTDENEHTHHERLDANLQSSVSSSIALPVFAIPAQRVMRILALTQEPAPGPLETSYLQVDGVSVPLYDLADSLGYRSSSARGGVALVIEHGSEMIALRAARVIGHEEVVAKPLAFPLSRIAYLAGAALLADGRAAFILEPGRLPLHAQERAASPPSQTEVVLN